jgi:hypothetical protein
LRVHTIGQGVGEFDELANETVDGHRFELVRIACGLG